MCNPQWHPHRPFQCGYGKLHLQGVISCAVAAGSFGTCGLTPAVMQDLRAWLHTGLAVYRTALAECTVDIGLPWTIWQATPAGCNQLCHSCQLFWYWILVVKRATHIVCNPQCTMASVPALSMMAGLSVGVHWAIWQATHAVCNQL